MTAPCRWLTEAQAGVSDPVVRPFAVNLHLDSVKFINVC